MEQRLWVITKTMTPGSRTYLTKIKNVNFTSIGIRITLYFLFFWTLSITLFLTSWSCPCHWSFQIILNVLKEKKKIYSWSSRMTSISISWPSIDLSRRTCGFVLPAFSSPWRCRCRVSRTVRVNPSFIRGTFRCCQCGTRWSYSQHHSHQSENSSKTDSTVDANRSDWSEWRRAVHGSTDREHHGDFNEDNADEHDNDDDDADRSSTDIEESARIQIVALLSEHSERPSRTIDQ